MKRKTEIWQALLLRQRHATSGRQSTDGNLIVETLVRNQAESLIAASSNREWIQLARRIDPYGVGHQTPGL